MGRYYWRSGLSDFTRTDKRQLRVYVTCLEIIFKKKGAVLHKLGVSFTLFVFLNILGFQR